MSLVFTSNFVFVTRVAVTWNVFVTIFFLNSRICDQNGCNVQVIYFSGYNHFEIKIIDEFNDSFPPPALALSTASPLDPAPVSNFRQDFLRFWATGAGKRNVNNMSCWILLILVQTVFTFLSCYQLHIFTLLVSITRYSVSSEYKR